MMGETEAPQAVGRSRNLLRELSDQSVLEVIFRDGPITRPELAARTGLSKPTVSDAVRRLMQERLIRSAGIRSGNLGRSPVSYMVDDAAGYVIGVDVGGTNVRVAAVNLFGELLKARTETQVTSSEKSLAQQVYSLVREMERTTGATHSQLLAVGASVTGIAPGTSAPAQDPLEVLQEKIGVPVFVDNGINLSAIGERWRGLAKGVSNFAFVSVGAAVGAGLVISDELVRGRNLAAGAISRIPIAGQEGAIPPDEMNAAAVMRRAVKMPWTGPPPTTIAEIFQRLESEESARVIITAEAQAIALVVATICALVDPGLVVLGGGIGSHPELLEPVRERTATLVSHPVEIRTSQLRDQAALYGALAVALQDAHGQLFRRDGRAVATVMS